MKIHVGCGKRIFPGWYHVDGADFAHINSKDIFLKSFDDDCAEIIYASHLIAYFDRDEIVELLTAWKRVLMPGGILRLATPDFGKMFIQYAKTKNVHELLGMLYGKMKMGEQTIYHRTVYDFASIEQVLKSVGFRYVHRYFWKETEHASIDDHSQAYLPHMDKENGLPMSLNIECTK